MNFIIDIFPWVIDLTFAAFLFGYPENDAENNVWEFTVSVYYEYVCIQAVGICTFCVKWKIATGEIYMMGKRCSITLVSILNKSRKGNKSKYVFI